MMRGPLSRARIGFVSDAEGSWDFFMRYAKKSRVLEVRNGGKVSLREEPNCYFVFGGYVQDYTGCIT